MTTGQRIAAKRKELSLSQEALGEALGVSRQSIYKWESDTSLPEIDKLVALSRLFSVSVGWLLGVEEESAAAEPEQAPAPSGELTETQLKMVEEIVGRYLAAQPKPKKRRRWPWVLAALATLYAGIVLFDKLERLDNQYNNLSYSIHNVTNTTSLQINSIASRVEEVLKAQNHLAADYSCQLLSGDLASNTVTFAVRVVPKTYVEGMEVLFVADSGEGQTTLPGAQGDNQEFTGEITCQLTNNITLSAVFVDGTTRQTQLLDTFEYLEEESQVYLDTYDTGSLMFLEPDKNGEYYIDNVSVSYLEDNGRTSYYGYGDVLPRAKVAKVKAGLFLNQELVQLLTPTPSEHYPDRTYYKLDPLSLKMENGDRLTFLLHCTDDVGRVRLFLVEDYWVEENELTWYTGNKKVDFSPEDWKF